MRSCDGDGAVNLVEMYVSKHNRLAEFFQCGPVRGSGQSTADAALHYGGAVVRRRSPSIYRRSDPRQQAEIHKCFGVQLMGVSKAGDNDRQAATTETHGKYSGPRTLARGAPTLKMTQLAYTRADLC